MDIKDYICFDFETGGLSWERNEAISVAAKAYDGKTLEPYPVEEGGEFNSLMKPLYFDRLEDGALAVNKITREELQTAPDQKVVWNQFITWVKKFNNKGTVYGAPIACGKNIRNFDLKFVEVLNRLHSPKKEKTVLFNTRQQVELEDIIHLFFADDTTFPNFKMDTLRDYFGMSHLGSHTALTDTRQTGALIMKFLRLCRRLREKRTKTGELVIPFRTAFAEQVG